MSRGSPSRCGKVVEAQRIRDGYVAKRSSTKRTTVPPGFKTTVLLAACGCRPLNERVAGATALKERSAAYVYAILVDGIVRYIGKGRNGRLYAHLIEAKRTAARSGAKTANLHPRWRRNLVQAIRVGSEITESVIGCGLTDEEAYRLESKIIADFHMQGSGLLNYDCLRAIGVDDVSAFGNVNSLVNRFFVRHEWWKRIRTQSLDQEVC